MFNLISRRAIYSNTLQHVMLSRRLKGVTACKQSIIAGLSLQSTSCCCWNQDTQRTLSSSSSSSSTTTTTSSKSETNSDESKSQLKPDFDDGIDSYTRTQMQKRHQGIIMNENGLSQHVLPGGYIVKTNQKTGDKKMVGLERSMGYFWDLKDLTDTDNKPILSNMDLIPLDISQVFPPLTNHGGDLKNLEDEEIVSLPEFITKNNRAKDPGAECTLVVICFNEYGNKMLPTWTEPFEHAFTNDKNRVKVIWITINEGWSLNMLRYFIVKGSKKNIPDHRKKDYLIYFGECPEFRDILRMHNRKTGYAFLLDGLGRLRFAGSGEASEDEVKRLISFTKELAPGLKADKRKTGVRVKA